MSDLAPSIKTAHRRTAWRWMPAALVAAAPACVWAGQPFPPPGLYRVDMVGTQSSSAGGMTAEQTTTVQGATGNTTATQRVTGQPSVAARSHAGQAPLQVCIQPGAAAQAAPAAAMAGLSATACKPMGPTVIDGDTARFSVQCATLEQDLQSRRIDATTWEWRTTTRMKNPDINSVPPATAAAMAPVIAQMEAQLRSTPPGAEADGLRQSLNAIQGRNAAGASSGTVISAVQRYTRVADRCN